MRTLKLAAALALVALTASPSLAAMHHRKHSSKGGVNGPSSVQAPNGQRKATRSGGPAGGSNNQ